MYVREWDPAREQLASYSAERARRLIRLSTGLSALEPTIDHIEAVTFTSRLAQRFREGRGFLVGDAAHQATPRGGTTLDLLGDGLTLFTGPRREDWEAALAILDHAVPVCVRSLDPVTARALGVRDGGALLARPDGVPIAVWSPGVDAVGALAAAIASATARACEPRHAALAA